MPWGAIRMTNPTGTTTTTMRAVVQDRYGSSEVLRLAHVARPAIENDEVLVHVSAAGLDRGWLAAVFLGTAAAWVALRAAHQCGTATAVVKRTVEEQG